MNRFVIPASARSWVEVSPDSDFSIQNLPFGRASIGDSIRTVSRIGDYLVDLAQFGIKINLSSASPFDLTRAREMLFMALEENGHKLEEALIPVGDAEMLIPIRPTAFIDFYSGIHHAGNVGRMFRPDQPPLLPNYRWLPVGYNGRASTVVVSGTDIVRPKGQIKLGENDPIYAPTRELDFELEVGFFTGFPSPMGATIPIDKAEEYLLGLVIVNDWSARDVQRWEYQPLGPFLAKSFGTSISPWIVTMDALEPFRVDGDQQDPPALPHLATSQAHYDIRLEVLLQTPAMTAPQVIATSNTRNLYWSFTQQLTHQASNGTLIEHGDLYASGTISGQEEGTFGSLLELTWRGTKPLLMAETNEERKFLEDGDRLTMRAYAQGDGFRVGFGEVTGKVQPAN